MFGRHFGRGRRAQRWGEQRKRHGFDHPSEPPEEHDLESRHEGRGHHRWRGDAPPIWFMPRGRHDSDHPFHGHGPFGGGPFGEGGGGRQRRRRGDIKYALLELIAEQPRHGYDLMKELEQRYGGFYRPSPGSVYPTLQLLEDEGYVTSEAVDGKRIYAITEAGRTFLERKQGGERERRQGFRDHGPDPQLETLRESSMALFAGVTQVARHGSPTQVQAAIALLDATRREIYALLAREEAPYSGGQQP